MKNIIVSAPGKIHLLGEHTVVYGKPAILAAIDKRTIVKITPTKEKYIRIIAEHTNQHMEVTPEIILQRMQTQRSVADVIDFAMLCMGQAFQFYAKNISSGFILTIQSDIPIGSGMGSSASLAVAIAGAVTVFLKKPWDKEQINTIAFLCELFIHGNPSGGDNSVCCYGGLIWYRKETDDLKIIQPLPFSLSKNLSEKFTVLFTGRPMESTGDMVRLVAKRKKKESILSSQEQLTKELLYALKNNNEKEIIDIIQKGEKNLEKLGVVSSSTKTLIRAIEQIDGAAKICGAGGKKKASGIILAFHPHPQLIDSIAKQYNVKSFPIQLGEEGVRKE